MELPIRTEGDTDPILSPGPLNVCLVPSPGGPVPSPCPCATTPSEGMGKGATHVWVHGKMGLHPPHLKGGGTHTTKGGIPQGGASSGTIVGKASFTAVLHSNVYADGKRVVTQMSMADGNSGNVPPPMMVVM